MDSRSEASERFLNERREYWRRVKREEEKYSKVHSPRKADAPQKKQESLSKGLSSAPVRGTITDSETSERFLNERRQYWRQIRKVEGSAPRLDVKNEIGESKKQKSDNTKDSNSLTVWQIILMIIVGGLIGWLIAEAGSLILLFALFIGALFLKCLR